MRKIKSTYRVVFLSALLLNFLGIFEKLNAQTTSDSLIEVAKYAKGKTRAEVLLELSAAYVSENKSEEAKEAAKEALIVSEEHDFQAGIAEGYELVADAMNMEQNYAEALEYYRKSIENWKLTTNKSKLLNCLMKTWEVQKIKNMHTEMLQLSLEAVELATDLNDNRLMALTLYKTGKTYEILRSYGLALENYLKAEKIFAQMKSNFSATYEDKTTLADILVNTGNIYFSQQNYQVANEYFFKCLDNSKEIDYKAGIAAAYNNIGEIHRVNSNFEQALDYYAKSLELNEELDLLDAISTNCHNIGITYQAIGKSDEALVYCFKSISISKLTENKEQIAAAYNTIGSLCNDMNDYNKAIDYFNAAIENANQIQSFLQIKNAAEGLSLAYAEKQNFKEAYEYHKLFKNMSDTLYNVENTKQITQLQMQFEFEKQRKIQEVEQQKYNLEIENKQLIINFFIAATLLALLIIGTLIVRFFYIKQTNKKLQIQNEVIHNKEKELIKKDAIHLKEKIDAQNRELASKAMILAKNKELSERVIEDLKSVKLLLNSKGRKQNEINQLIANMMNELKISTDTDAWAEFELRFEQVHQSFYDNLLQRYPKLTPNEKKLCAFLRLNMTTKDISSITFQSPQSIEVARTRLRKKLELSNTEINLSQFLADF